MKTSPRLRAVLLALAALPLAQVLYPGCATMVNGPRQELRVKSVPKGAWVFLNGKKDWRDAGDGDREPLGESPFADRDAGISNVRDDVGKARGF